MPTIRTRLPDRLSSYVSLLALVLASVGQALITWAGWYWSLSFSLLLLAYLLPLLAVSCVCQRLPALLFALATVLLMNYFFIPPRYTWQIASAESWLMLCVFLTVAGLMSHILVQRNLQRAQAEQSAAEAHCLQTMAALLAQTMTTQALLDRGCETLSGFLSVPVTLVQATANAYAVNPVAGVTSIPAIRPSAVAWTHASHRPLGAGTTDWPELDYTILPFACIEAQQVADAAAPLACVLLDAKCYRQRTLFVQLCVHQWSQAYVQRCLQEDQQQQAQQYRDAEFKKTVLLALSHDMRTPLTVIRGAADALSDPGLQLTASAREGLLHSIRQESVALSQQSENVLSWVRLNTVTERLPFDWQVLEDIVQHVVERFSQRPHAVKLAVHYAHGDCICRVDALLLAQALTNLLENACQWHSGDTAITVSTRVTNAGLQLSVCNVGLGFPPEFVIQAFNRGQQRQGPSSAQAEHVALAGAQLEVDAAFLAARTRPGFGLGLSLVQAIMQAHAGEVQLQHQPEHATSRLGLTTVTLCLPASLCRFQSVVVPS